MILMGKADNIDNFALEWMDPWFLVVAILHMMHWLKRLNAPYLSVQF